MGEMGRMAGPTMRLCEEAPQALTKQSGGRYPDLKRPDCFTACGGSR